MRANQPAPLSSLDEVFFKRRSRKRSQMTREVPKSGHAWNHVAFVQPGVYALPFSESKNLLRAWAEASQSPNVSALCVIQYALFGIRNTLQRYDPVTGCDVRVPPAAIVLCLIYDADGCRCHHALEDGHLEAVDCDTPPLPLDVFT
jgi:hypothetical protein